MRNISFALTTPQIRAFERLRTLLNEAALSGWTLQKIQSGEDYNDALYGDIVTEKVVRAAHVGRKALTLLEVVTPDPQTAMQAQVEQLPRYAYKEIYREDWPGDTKGIYECADGDLISRADVLALCAETPPPETT